MNITSSWNSEKIAYDNFHRRHLYSLQFIIYELLIDRYNQEFCGGVAYKLELNSFPLHHFVGWSFNENKS